LELTHKNIVRIYDFVHDEATWSPNPISAIAITRAEACRKTEIERSSFGKDQLLKGMNPQKNLSAR